MIPKACRPMTQAESMGSRPTKSGRGTWKVSEKDIWLRPLVSTRMNRHGYLHTHVQTRKKTEWLYDQYTRSLIKLLFSSPRASVSAVRQLG